MENLQLLHESKKRDQILMESHQVVSVDEKGEISSEEPLILIKTNPNSKGGVRTLPFIIANEAFERQASQGIQPNMVIYLTEQYGLSAAQAANVLFLWSAATEFFPIVGAFMADSYVGRFRTIAFGSFVSLLGMVLLWSTTIIPQARPTTCSQFMCSSKYSATISQLLYLYSSFGLMSIGAGGIRSSSIAFGADQLVDKKRHNNNPNKNNAGTLRVFFSWYYVSITVSILIAVTCVVYIQDNFGWKIGFGVPVLLMLFSAISFFLASPFYVLSKANKSLLSGLAQVLVASYKNRDISLSPCGTNQLLYYHINGSMPKPSEKLRFLNKACIIRNPQQNLTQDGRASDPWSICSVNQVEELKALIKVIPIWFTGVFMAVVINQSSFPVLQATSMDRHITSNFEIPAGSFSLFSLISVILSIALYDRIILPILSKIKGKTVSLSLKKRMGIAIFFSCMSTVAAAVVESIRREMAIRQGFSENPQGVVSMSAVLWLLPQYMLLGLAAGLSSISLIEFFYSELPKTMSSIASSLNMLAMSVGDLIASFIMSTVDDITKRGNQESWVSGNINKGHYDYYCWLLAGLSFFNFVYFIVCSKAYGPCKIEGSEDFDGDQWVCDEEVGF